jgi:hypothetical protein
LAGFGAGGLNSVLVFFDVMALVDDLAFPSFPKGEI